MSAAFALPQRMVEKVWGRTRLPAPFAAPQGRRIGEIWFEPPPQMAQLLVKFLFTSEKLSVQVHPGEREALPGEKGKEECWLVLAARPGARIAIGLREEVDEARLRQAALDGSIEALLQWHDARAGDFFYLPAGTIHAIGPGLSLVEVQQNSDTTFRLFDYGRPRELHLDRALAVARRGPYPLQMRSHVEARSQCLASGPHFRLDRVLGAPDAQVAGAYTGPLLALPLEGTVEAEGAGKIAAGHCVYAERLGAIDFSTARVTLLMRPA